jgi:hypothetical protein
MSRRDVVAALQSAHARAATRRGRPSTFGPPSVGPPHPEAPAPVARATCLGVLVEIRPEGGRRHNSPLTISPSSEGVTAEGPLGDERNALLLPLPSLS